MIKVKIICLNYTFEKMRWVRTSSDISALTSKILFLRIMEHGNRKATPIFNGLGFTTPTMNAHFNYALDVKSNKTVKLYAFPRYMDLMPETYCKNRTNKNEKKKVFLKDCFDKSIDNCFRSYCFEKQRNELRKCNGDARSGLVLQSNQFQFNFKVPVMLEIPNTAKINTCQINYQAQNSNSLRLFKPSYTQSKYCSIFLNRGQTHDSKKAGNNEFRKWGTKDRCKSLDNSENGCLGETSLTTNLSVHNEKVFVEQRKSQIAANYIKGFGAAQNSLCTIKGCIFLADYSSTLCEICKEKHLLKESGSRDVVGFVKQTVGSKCKSLDCNLMTTYPSTLCKICKDKNPLKKRQSRDNIGLGKRSGGSKCKNLGCDLLTTYPSTLCKVCKEKHLIKEIETGKSVESGFVKQSTNPSCKTRDCTLLPIYPSTLCEVCKEKYPLK